jgi:hypothetical protein
MSRIPLSRQERADLLYERLLNAYANNPDSPAVKTARKAWQKALDEYRQEKKASN